MKRVLLAAFVLALAGASPVAATRSSSPSYSMPAWSPNGTLVALVGAGGGNEDLFVMHPDGTGIRQLTTSCSPRSGPFGPCNNYGARFPSWSPDSKQIAFGYGYSGICVINADGTGFHRISDSGDAPAWSPGGKKIAFMESDETSGAKVYVMNPDGTGKELVAWPSDLRSYEAPTWSTDGQLLAFGISTAPDTDVLPGLLGIISRYGGRVRTSLRGYNPFPPSWHGTRVAVTYDPITNDQNWPSHVRVGLYDTRTKTLKSLHRGDHPSWSPNGRRLVFRYHGNIWVINANGSGARRLTHG